MRWLFAISVVLVSSSVSAEDTAPTEDTASSEDTVEDTAIGEDTVPSDPKRLTSAEIARVTAPSLPAIKQCYFDHGRPAKGSTGELFVYLVIEWNGAIGELTVAARGVTGKRLRDLTRCIEAEAASWEFPERRDDTTSILPYSFPRINAPGTGPQYSCWSPRGCPQARHARK
jgi:hypothetical protein